MTEQLRILPDPQPAVVLTQYQQAVADFLEEHGQVNAASAGRVYHEHRGGHVCDDRCQLDRDGRSILEALVKKGVARRRRGTGTTLYEATGPSRSGYDPATTEIPF